MADGSIIIDTKLTTKEFEKGLSNLGNVASKGLSAVTKAVGAVSTGIVALGGYAAKVGTEFEYAMSGVAATMGMTAEEVNNGSEAFTMLEDAAKKAGATTQFSATQAAEALNYLALAGYNAEEASVALPKVLNLAAAGGLDLAYASDLVTDSMAALGLEMNELDSFMDKMAKTAQKSNTSVAQLGEATLTVGGTAKTLSGGVTEMNTALGILADVGIKGSEGGTALRNVILSLTSPTDKAAGALEDLGVVVSDEQGNMRGLEEIFTDLNSSMTGLGTVAKQQILNEIFNKVDLKAVSGLMAATVVDMSSLGEAINQLGIDAETNADMIAYLAATFEVGEDKAEFCNYAMQEMGITAEQASGMYDSLSEAVQNGSNRFDELSGYIENAEGACATMADTMNDNLMGRITQLQSATEGLGIDIYKHMELPLKSAAEAGIEAVGQLSSALETGGFSAMAEAIGDVLAQGISKIAECAPQVVQMAVSIIQAFVQGINESLPEILNAAVSIIGSLATGILELLPTLIEIGGQILQQLATSIIENAPQMFETAQETLTYLLDGFIQNIDSILEIGMEILIALTEGIKDTLPELIPLAIDALIAFAEAVLDNIDTVLECGIEIILAIVDGIVNALPTLIEKVPEIINAFWDAFDRALIKIVECGAKIIVKLGKGILDNIPVIIANAGEIVKAILNTIMHLDMIKMGKTLMTNLSKGIKNMLSNIKGTAKEVIDKLKAPFTESFNNFKEIGKNIIQGLIDGVKGMISNVTGAIKGVCEKAINAAKSALGIHSPSRVFKNEVGKWVGEGLAEGIHESSEKASHATVDMCNAILTDGKAFLAQQKAQDKAWSDSKKEQYAAQKTALYEYIERKKELNQMSLEDEKYIYNQLLKAAKGNQKEIDEINKKIVEAEKEAYQERYKNSKQFIADKKYFNQMSLQDELSAYERMKDYSKGHAEETKEIEKEIYRVKKEIKEQEIQDVKDANSKILDELKNRVDKEKAIITGRRDSELDALQAQIDAIDKAEEERQNNITIADYETSIQKIKEQLANAIDPEEQQKLNEQLFEKQSAFNEWKYQQELKAKKESIRDQMNEVRAQADEEISVVEEGYEKQKTLLEATQQAMIEAIQKGEAEKVRLIQDATQQTLAIQDATAIETMGINKSLTEDKQENLNQQYQAVIDNENKSAQAVEDACVEMYRKNYKMGTQMANGIADGILNQTWRAVKAVGMMCDQMIAECKSRLDIHSPSRVFRQLGEFVDKGLEVGIDGESDGVINSMSSMCKRLTDSVNIDDLVGKMSAAVNGEVAVTANAMTGTTAHQIMSSANTITTDNSSHVDKIEINNYNTDGRGLDERKLGRQVEKSLRGKGVSYPC